MDDQNIVIAEVRTAVKPEAIKTILEKNKLIPMIPAEPGGTPTPADCVVIKENNVSRTDYMQVWFLDEATATRFAKQLAAYLIAGYRESRSATPGYDNYLPSHEATDPALKIKTDLHRPNNNNVYKARVILTWDQADQICAPYQLPHDANTISRNCYRTIYDKLWLGGLRDPLANPLLFFILIHYFGENNRDPAHQKQRLLEFVSDIKTNKYDYAELMKNNKVKFIFEILITYIEQEFGAVPKSQPAKQAISSPLNVSSPIDAKQTSTPTSKESLVVEDSTRNSCSQLIFETYKELGKAVSGLDMFAGALEYYSSFGNAIYDKLHITSNTGFI